MSLIKLDWKRPGKYIIENKNSVVVVHMIVSTNASLKYDC